MPQNIDLVEKRKSSRKRIHPRRLLIAISIIIVLFLIGNISYYAFLNQKTSQASSFVENKQYTVFIDESTPQNVKSNIQETLEKLNTGEKSTFQISESSSSADIIISNENATTEAEAVETHMISEIRLLPVGHAYWINEDADFTSAETILVANENLVAELESKYANAQVIYTDQLLTTLESSDESKSIGLIEENQLTPHFKVLNLGGTYPLDSGERIEIAKYIYLNVEVEPHLIVWLDENVRNLFAQSNESKTGSDSQIAQDDISTINMSGVVALSRNLAVKIDNSKNPAYPSTKIAEFLSKADLTHVSNEVSFVPGCTPTQSLSFCSAPEYIASLEAIGTDIVELTGNHNNDYGAQFNTTSIETYKSLGWDYFGGGLNKEDAAKILVKELNNTKVAFVGYNYYNTVTNAYGALASDTNAGANWYDPAQVQLDITKANELADVVIVTFQFQECYSYPPSDVIYKPCYKADAVLNQEEVFRSAVDAGADIVVGTQAHQPQTYEIYNGKMIYYGLGNLFFDQIPWIGTRQGLILTHYFANGEHIQTKLTTTLYDQDMITYVSEGEDRELLLKLLKEARN